MRIILSTTNVAKAEQIRQIFNDTPVTISTLEDLGIYDQAIEDGHTLRENALKKALFAHNKTDGRYWTMADDTGVFINALQGAPGIHSARWAGERASTQDIMNYCLHLMQDKADRSAYFETVAVLISPEGEYFDFSGKVEGSLLVNPRVMPRPSLPYSSIFVPHGYDRSWAEMTAEESNAISHRGIAFRLAASYLKQCL